MESTLHRQLKDTYARGLAPTEVVLGDFRIDVVQPGLLVEIQHGPLAAIQRKIQKLVIEHRVLVVKPILVERFLVKLDKRHGQIIGRRKSPKQGTLLDIFDELIHFTGVFPHPNLTIQVPLVDVEEIRFPGAGRRRRRGKNDFQVQDRVLVGIRETHYFSSCHDLMRLIPSDLPSPFHTGHLSKKLNIHRWIAQRIAYCLRKTKAIQVVGKVGNAHLYEFSEARNKAHIPLSRQRRRVKPNS